jgi:formylglycine-generating enzyme required for sulfatase activity
MAGNVWQFVNDWYGQNYYGISPYDNPKGPDSGFIMPDGKPYRGMRGGNWYNGYPTGGVNDGHSRVSNRNPSYYRGPQDPNHPWYHVGFRVVRNDGAAFDAPTDHTLLVMLQLTGPQGADMLRRHP